MPLSCKLLLVMLAACLAAPAVAQDTAVTQPAAPVVPHLVRYSGLLNEAPAGTPAVTARFAVYAAQTGGEPLWAEEQQVSLDSAGKYSVLLGAVTPLPDSVFAAGDARWIGVALAGRDEGVRTPLTASVYALKAEDAQTLDGHPISDFAMAGLKPKPDAGTDITQINVSSGILGGGTGPTVSLSADPAYFNANYAQLAAANTFSAANTFGKGFASTVATGTAPFTVASTTAVANLNASLLGGVAATGYAQLAVQNTFTNNEIFGPSAPATTSTGHSSNFLWLNASVWNSSKNAAQNIGFQWRAEPLDNNTATPNANFALLSTVTSATPQETGFKITANGIITFVAAQTFPGTVSTTANNTYTGTQTINGNETISASDTTGSPLIVNNTSTTTGYGLQVIGPNGMAASASNTSSGTGLYASGPYAGVYASATNTSNPTFGVEAFGSTSNAYSTGVYASGYTAMNAAGSSSPQGSSNVGIGLNATGAHAVVATSNETDNYGLGVSAVGGTAFNVSANGYAPATTGVGVSASGGIGVIGTSTDPNSNGYGVLGNGGSSSIGVIGYGANGVVGVATDGFYGVVGEGGAETGVLGESTGAGYGLWGTSSSGYGVYGYGQNTGGYFLGGCCNTPVNNDSLPAEYGATGLGEAGMIGLTLATSPQTDSSIGWGVIGLAPSYGADYSTTGLNFANGTAAGVWGDASYGGDASGVLATADSRTALIAVNNSDNPTMEVLNDTSSAGETIFEAIAPNVKSGNGCTINSSGDLNCSGSVSMVVKADEKQVAMYAVTSPENWHEDFGSGAIQNGSGHVALDPQFASTVNTDVDYHVFLTPRGDSGNLYVTNATASGFDVRESHGGKSSVAFDYRIVARRKGLEQVRMADMTARMDEMRKRESDRAEAMARPRPGRQLTEAEKAQRKTPGTPAPMRPPMLPNIPRSLPSTLPKPAPILPRPTLPPGPSSVRAANEAPQR